MSFLRACFCLLISLPCLALDAPVKPAPLAPKEHPLTREERPIEWLMAIERLRQFPRAGDIQNAGVLANIGDIVETTPEQQASIAAQLKAYDAALLEKTKQWESELATLRVEHEAKLVASLPEARRDAAKKALDYSHAQWTTPFDFEVRLRSDFLQKKSAATEADASHKEFVTFIKTQRVKAQEHDAETLKTLKSLLDPKEAERLNFMDKNRVVPVTEKKK